MGKINRIVTGTAKALLWYFKGYVQTGQLLYTGIKAGGKALGRLIWHSPIHTVFVVVITGVMVTMSASIVNSETLKILPYALRVATICIIGVSAFIGSICWSMKAISYRR